MNTLRRCNYVFSNGRAGHEHSQTPDVREQNIYPNFWDVTLLYNTFGLELVIITGDIPTPQSLLVKAGGHAESYPCASADNSYLSSATQRASSAESTDFHQTGTHPPSL